MVIDAVGWHQRAIRFDFKVRSNDEGIRPHIIFKACPNCAREKDGDRRVDLNPTDTSGLIFFLGKIHPPVCPFSMREESTQLLVPPRIRMIETHAILNNPLFRLRRGRKSLNSFEKLFSERLL